MKTTTVNLLIAAALIGCGGSPQPDQTRDGGNRAVMGGVAASLGGTIYVDCSQGQDGVGTQAAPFNTLADLNTMIAPGAQLRFKRGVTCHGRLVTLGSGTATAPIIVGAYGSGTARPVIAGDGVSGHGVIGAAVSLYNQEYWEINDLEVTNQGATAAERNGVLIVLENFTNGTSNAGTAIGIGHHYRLNNLFVHDVNGDDTPAKWSNGIQFRVRGNQIPNNFDDIIVSNSEIKTVDREGLTLWSDQSCRAQFGCSGTANWRPSTNVIFRQNYIHDIGGDGLIIRVSNGAQVYGNLGAYLAQRSHYANAGFWTINSDGSDFNFNEVHHVKKNAYNNDGTAFDSDYGNNDPIFRHNYSHDNEGGFMLLCGGCGGSAYTKGTVIRYNLSVNDRRGIIVADGSGVFAADGSVSGAAKFHNNTIYLPAGSSTAITTTHLSSYKTGVDFKNNIFYNLGTGGYLSGTTFRSSWSNNLFYGSSHGAEPNDPLGIFADPQFVGPAMTAGGYPTGFANSVLNNYSVLNGYRIAPTSPAVAKGALTGLPQIFDLFNIMVPSRCAPDIGASQIQAAKGSCI